MTLKRGMHRLLAPLLYGEHRSIVPGRVADYWPQRRFVRRLLRELRIDCVLDVGANRGQFGRELRTLGFDGLILSFEPSPQSFELLRRESHSDPRWEVFDFALGATEGQAELNCMLLSVFDSFRQPSTKETTHHDALNQVMGKVTVPVRRLDVVLPELQQRFGFRRPYLKTDTQGFDLEVFRGGEGVWRQILALQAELPIKRIYQDTPTLADALATYEAAGFDLIGLFPVNPDDRPMVELDCFLQRRN